MSGPEWKLNDDLKSVTVIIPTIPPTLMKLDADQVSEMLHRLGEFRALMQPGYETTAPFGQKVNAVPDPHWSAEPDLMAGDSLLHLRDPRFGWLHYLLPRNEAQKLGQLLLTQATNQPLEPGSSH